MDPKDYIDILQYGVLTGAYEGEISGTFVAAGSTITFTPACPYSYNKEIHIIVKAGFMGSATNGMLTQYESIFTTMFYPMYSTAVLVKMAGGALLDNVKEDPINRLILQHSIIVQNIWPETIDTCDIPFFITRYITCKVAYELLSGSIQQYIGGAISKRLGDFEIEGIRDVPGLIRPKLAELQACINTMIKYILNEGKLHAEPQWSARAKQKLEDAPHLNRVPLRVTSTRDITDLTSEEYFVDGAGPKNISF